MSQNGCRSLSDIAPYLMRHGRTTFWPAPRPAFSLPTTTTTATATVRTACTTATTTVMASTMAGNITDVPFFSDNASLHHYVHAAPPFYFTSRPTVFNRISDETLSLVVPIVAYWGYSLFFQILDSLDWSLLNKYRIHESAEVKTRNRVTKTDVLLAVIFQQVVQTALGIYWINGDEDVHSCLTDLGSIRNAVVFGARHLLGEPTAVQFLRAYGPVSVWFLYWWAIPLGQLVFAM